MIDMLDFRKMKIAALQKFNILDLQTTSNAMHHSHYIVSRQRMVVFVGRHGGL